MREKKENWEAWIFLAAVAFGQTMLFGTVVSGGLLNAYLLEAFDESRGFTSIPFAIANGLQMMGGILVTPVVNKLGCRAGLIVAAVLASSGAVVSSFATGIGFLIPSFGVLAGVGMAFGFLTANVAVGKTFDRHRVVAFALLSTGMASGILIVPPLVHFLTDVFSWRGSLLILGGLCLHHIAAALLYPEKHVRGETILIRHKEHESTEYIGGMSTETGPVFGSAAAIDKSQKLSQESPSGHRERDIGEGTKSETDNIQDSAWSIDMKSNEAAGNKNVITNKNFPPKFFYWDIFRNNLYVITLLSVVSRGVGKNIFNVHLIAVGVYTVLNIDEGPNVLLIMGGIHLVIRPVSGVLVNFISNRKRFIWGMSATMIGIIALCGPKVTDTRTGFYIFVSAFCFLDAIYEALYLAVHFDAVGEKRFSSALGATGLLYGISQASGPPIAGLLYDKYHTYDGLFYLAGSSYLAGGLLTCLGQLLPYLLRKR